jgi:translocation and assembly module TamB
MIDTPPETPKSPPQDKRLRRRFRLLWLEMALFGLVVTTALLIVLAASPVGTRLLVVMAERLSLGALQVSKVDGTLWGHLSLGNIRFHNDKISLAIDRASVDWQPADLLAGQLTIDRLALGRMALLVQPSQQPTVLPDAMVLPVSVVLRQATLAQLNLAGQDVLDHLEFAASSDGRHHKLSLLHAGTPWFAGQGEVRLDGARPFKLGGALALSGETDNASWRVNATLANRLDDISVKGGGSGGPSDVAPFRADFDVRLNPFATSPYGILRAGRVETVAVDLHTLAASLPRTALNLSLSAAPHGEHVQTRLVVSNALAGGLAAARLPLARLEAAFTLDARQVQVDQFDATLAGGRVQLAGTIRQQALALTVGLDRVDLAQLDGPAWPLSARLRLDGAPATPHAAGSLQVPDLAADIDIAVAATPAGRQVLARRLALHAGNGQLEASGQFVVAGNRAFKVDGHLSHFDPASLGKLLGHPIANGDVNGSLQLDGALGPTTTAKLAMNLRDSRLNGQALAGSAAGEWHGDHLDGVAVDLALGGNRLKASGALGRPGDGLMLDVSLPSLADIGSGFGGRLEGKLRLAGNLRRPTVEGNARAEGLRLPGELSVARASLTARLDATSAKPADSPVSLKLDVQGLTVAKLALANGHLSLAGARAAHVAELQGQGKLAGQAFDISVRAGGGFDAGGWRGRIDQLENTGDMPMRLNAPARLTLSGSGGSVEGLDAIALGTKLTLSRAEWQGARFNVVGDVRELALGEWLGHVPDLKHRITTDLVLAAHFDLHGDERLAGNLWLARQSGDVALLVDDPTVKPMPLKLSSARATLDLAGDRATVALDLKSAAFGSAVGRLATHFERTEHGWRPAGGAPLEGSLHAEMPALNWVGPLLGPTAGVNGRLSADLTAGGVVGAPTWFGRLKLDDFALRLPELGANWHDGKLEATLEGETAQLATFSLKAGKGEASAAGRLSLRDSGPEGALTVKFDQFGALTRPDRNLIVSGESTLAMQGQLLSLTGKLKADEGAIELPKRDAPVLGDDVVVKGRVERPRTGNKAPPMNLHFDLDLGEHFYYKGQGVEAKLSGSVRVTASPTQRLGASGALKVEEGRYVAYGQNLAISRGIVTFQGPLDNPALDILAERKNLPISVGVKIVGTTLAPRVSLTSDQAIPDSEKLSWLVLGHGSTSTTGRGDADVLLAAADALFSAGQSVSLRQQLAGSLGLDDISVGRSTAYGVTNDAGTSNGSLPGSTTGVASTTNPALATRVVTLGKRLSDRAYVSYEQSLDSVGYAVKLTYQLTRRVSLALSAGQTSAVDVLYSWLFD